MQKQTAKEKKNIELYQAFLKLGSVEECARFMRDLCTEQEIETLSERWQVAQKVDNKIPYRKISEDTGASTATITRVAHWLHHGMGGYKLMLDRIKN